MMLKDILDIVALFIVRSNVLIISLLPQNVSINYATFFVRAFLIFMPRHKDVAYKNMDIIFPGISLKHKEELLKKNYRVMGENILGFINGPTLTKSQVINSLNTENAKEAIKLIRQERKTGCLLLIPHFGSFELLSHYWALFDKPYSIIAREFALPRVNKWWNKMREATGNKIFTRKGGYKSIVNEIKKGQNVALLFDQNVKSNHAMFVDFFGLPAATTKSFALASLRTNCPIILATMVKNSEGKYTLYAKEINAPTLNEGSKDQKIHTTIREVHNKLEDTIKKHPEQWFWIHRRYKTRPPGELENIYK